MPINQNPRLGRGLWLRPPSQVHLPLPAPRGVLVVVAADEVGVEEVLEARARSLPHRRIPMWMTGR